MSSLLFDKILVDDSLVVSQITNESERYLITYLNQHCYNTYCSDSEYKKILDSQFTVYLDGVGVYYALKFLGYDTKKRFNASDLNTVIFSLFKERKTPIFILGGKFGKDYIKKQIESFGLNFKGYLNGFDEVLDKDIMLRAIKESKAEVVIIGISIPKQEKIAEFIYEKVDNVSILCIGNFMEFFLGTKSRVPELFRNSGFEWLHRFISEPSRLWKRYLIGIPVFIYRILRLKIIS